MIMIPHHADDAVDAGVAGPTYLATSVHAEPADTVEKAESARRAVGEGGGCSRSVGAAVVESIANDLKGVTEPDLLGPPLLAVPLSLRHHPRPVPALVLEVDVVWEAERESPFFKTPKPDSVEWPNECSSALPLPSFEELPPPSPPPPPLVTVVLVEGRLALLMVPPPPPSTDELAADPGRFLRTAGGALGADAARAMGDEGA